MSQRARVFLAVALVFGAPAIATADPREEADKLLAEGKAAGEAGKPKLAIKKFREAERLFPRAVHLCNIGLAYATLKKLPLALIYLERCRGDARSFPTWVAQRQGEIAAELARTHAPIEVRSDPTDARITVTALGDDEPLESGEKVFLKQGSWRFDATRAGHKSASATVTVENLAGQEVELVLESEAPPEAPPEPPPQSPAGPPPEDRAREPRSRIVPWIVVGAGVVSAGAGVLLHLAANEAKRDATKLPPGDEFDERRDAYRRNGWLAAGAYAAGAVGIGLGVFLLVRSDPGEEPAVAVSLGEGHAMVFMSFSR